MEVPESPVVLSSNLSLREAVARVVAGIDAPVSRAELVRHVLAIRPSQSRRPDDLIMAEIRRHTDLVRMRDGRYTSPAWVFRDIRFRYRPTDLEAANSLLPFFPCFIPFALEPDRPLAEHGGQSLVTLIGDSTGEPIPWEAITLHGALQMDNSGDSAIRFQALSLRSWFEAQRFAPGDSVLLTIEDPKRAVFRLRHEAAGDANRAAIAVQDAALEAALVHLVEKSAAEQPFIEEIVPAVYARLYATARAYPGNHWHAVVARSPRLRLVDNYAIARATFRRPIDRLFGYETPPEVAHDLEARIDAFQTDLREMLGTGPPKEHVTLPKPCGSEEALHRSLRQITAFLNGGAGRDDEEGYRCLAIPSIYLAKHEGVSLADADGDMLARFLLSYYPRRVLLRSKAFTSRMLATLRRFYLAQEGANGRPVRPALPRLLSRLHAFIDRKIALSTELDGVSPQTSSLFAKLFPDREEDDAEILSVPVPE